MKIVIYKTYWATWIWWIIAKNGVAVGRSTTAYQSKRKAIEVATRVFGKKYLIEVSDKLKGRY